MGVREQIKAEWRPPCSIAKIQSSAEVVAKFRTSTGWKIDGKVLQSLIPGKTAEGLENDLEEMDSQSAWHVPGGYRHSSTWNLGLLDTTKSMAASKSLI